MRIEIGIRIIEYCYHFTTHHSQLQKDMSELTVATRYAKSIIDLAEEKKSLEEIRKDMELFSQTLKANHRAAGGFS